MAEVPNNVSLASGFIPAPPDQAWARLNDPMKWPEVFPGWIASIVDDDDRLTGTGPQKERFDLYSTIDEDALAVDVEVVDELGSADTFRLRVLAVTGGSLVVVTHGRLMGMPDVAWEAKRDAVIAGLAAL